MNWRHDGLTGMTTVEREALRLNGSPYGGMGVVADERVTLRFNQSHLLRLDGSRYDLTGAVAVRHCRNSYLFFDDLHRSTGHRVAETAATAFLPRITQHLRRGSGASSEAPESAEGGCGRSKKRRLSFHRFI